MNVIFSILVVLIVIASILLTIAVLLQNGKGDSLASNFVAGNQTFGVRQTANMLEKITWGLVAFILVVAVDLLNPVDATEHLVIVLLLLIKMEEDILYIRPVSVVIGYSLVSLNSLSHVLRIVVVLGHPLQISHIVWAQSGRTLQPTKGS